MDSSAALKIRHGEKTAPGRRTAQTPAAAPRAPSRRVARAALVALLGLGSLALWTVVPMGWIWIASALSDRYSTIYLVAILGCPLVMILWGWGLYRINRVYLRLSGGDAAVEPRNWLASAGEKRPVMLLDVLVMAGAVVALIALVVWFFFFAGSPTSTPIPDEFSGQGQ
jgi:hypothetical protein